MGDLRTLPKAQKTHCSRGHEYAVLGRYADGHCSECGRIKGRESQPRRARSQKRWRDRNPEKMLAMQRRNDLKRNFGLTVAEYDALLQMQHGVCATCHQVESTKRKGTLMRLAVDHDHTTGQIRGLLCNNCNRAIGLLKDDVSVLEEVLAYLQKWKRSVRAA